MPRLLLSMFLFSTAAIAGARGDWPQFRGPTGQGHADAAPLNWSEDAGVRWKTPLRGRGWSSPVVAAGKIWVTAAVEQEPTAEQKRELAARYSGHPEGRKMGTVAAVDLWAIQLDAESGSVLHEVKLFSAENPEPVHGLNSYASPTPVLDGGRCYCHFGTFGTACLDADTAEVSWKTSLPLEHMVGPGSSPVVCEDRLIIPCDGCDRQFVAALNVADGSIAWETPRPAMSTDVGDLQKAFCTPLTIEVDGAPQAVVPGAQWFASYDPRTGEELWRVNHGTGFSNVPRPVYDGRHVFLCTGFGTNEMWAVDPTGRGDVTATHVAWRAKGKRIPTQPSPVLIEDRIYVVSDSGIAGCYDATTGDPVWFKRLGGNYSASPLAVDGLIYYCSREGVTMVVEAGDKYRLRAKNRLDGALMASPAVVDGDLLLRTDTHLYRITGK